VREISHEVCSQAPNRFAQQQDLLRARLLNLYPPPPPPPPDITLLKKENAQTVEEYFRALTIEQHKAPEEDPAAAAAAEAAAEVEAQAAAERPLSAEQVVQAEEAEEDRSPGVIDIAPGRRRRHRHLLSLGDEKPPSAQELRKKEKFTLLDSKSGILPDTERVRVCPISLTCVAQFLPQFLPLGRALPHLPRGKQGPPNSKPATHRFPHHWGHQSTVVSERCGCKVCCVNLPRLQVDPLLRVRAVASERGGRALTHAVFGRAQFYADGRARTVRPGVGAKLHAVPPPPGVEIRVPNPPHAPHRPASPLNFYAENEAMKKEGNFLWELAVGENTLEVRSTVGKGRTMFVVRAGAVSGQPLCPARRVFTFHVRRVSPCRM